MKPYAALLIPEGIECPENEKSIIKLEWGASAIYPIQMPMAPGVPVPEA
jgi:hypothetical protein